MAQLLGPDENTRISYALKQGLFHSGAGALVSVFSDAQGTTLAPINEYQPANSSVPGPLIPGSVVTVDVYSKLPLFWFPDGVTTLYASSNGGPLVPINAALQPQIASIPSTIYWKEGGSWANNTPYSVNSIVLYTNNNLSRYYRCVTAHTSAATGGLDFSKFVAVSIQESTSQFEFLPRDWAAATFYISNQLVVVDDGSGHKLLYRNKTGHTSAATFSADQSNWDQVGGASGGTGSPLVLPTTVTGTAYQFALTDAGDAVEFTNASAITLTVPPNNLVPFPQGTIIEILQRGAGQITITPGAGVTIRTASSAATRTQYSVATLRLSGFDEWILAGDLV